MLPQITLLFLSLGYVAAQAASNPALASCASLRPSYPAPSLAPGYKAQLIARNLRKPRGLAVDNDGRLLIIEQGVGVSSLSVHETAGCWSPVVKSDVVRNANLTHGITVSSDGKTLYASTITDVLSWPYKAGKASGDGKSLIAVTTNSISDHITRTLLYAKKQKNTLLVSRGSESNVDMASVDLATGHCQIKSFPTTGNAAPQNFNTTGKLLGWGLRNSVGIAEHPVTGGIYSVDMGMDWALRDGKDLHANNPGDELNYHGIIGKFNDLDQGLNHGYPYCHAAWDVNAIPNKSDLVFGNQFLLGAVNSTVAGNDTMNDAVCARQRAAPVITLPPHQAPIDLKFRADGTEAYISFHGSWNRQTSVGYKVSKVNFKNGKPAARPDSKTAVIDIMSNKDVKKCGQIKPYVWNKDCFRPAGLAFDKAGNLFMSSDETGEIWVISKVKDSNVVH